MKGNDEQTTMAARAVTVQRAFRRGGLSRTLLFVFLPLVIGSMIVVSVLSSLYGIREGRARAFNQLELVATLKELEISRWLRERDRDLAVLTGEHTFQQETVRLLDEASTEPERLAAYSNLGIRLNEFLGKKVSFAELFLLDAVNGRTVVSTDVLQEGVSHRDTDYFQQGLQGPFLRPPEFDPRLNVPTLLLARPVLAEGGQAVGVLVGRVNLGDLSVLMLERTGLGGTGETYLVDQSFEPVTRLRFGQAVQRVDTVGARQSLAQHTAGSGQYDNYQDIPVFGVYRWIPELQVALLAEQSEEEALAGLRGTLLGLLGLMVGAGVLATLAVAFISQRITRPITRLTEAATEVASGDLSRRVAIVRQDEIGALSQAFDGMADQLQELIGTLERRVAERTRGLQTAAEIARATTLVLDPDELIRQAVDLIRERFDLYHVGLCLLDEERRFAVLRAGTGEAGRKGLERGLRLEVGDSSMVGWCTAHAQPRVALDVRQDTVYLEDPLLPDTRSEAVLPLIARGRVIGALDVQSAEVAAFDEADIAVMQTMADQVAVAIDNTRLFAEAQAALAEMETTHRRYLGQAWAEYVQTAKKTSYETERPGVAPLGDAALPEIQQAVERQRVTALTSPSTSCHGELVEPSGHGDGAEGPVLSEVEGKGHSALVAPITLRGKVIGALGIHDEDGARQWTDDEIALVEAITERVALAAENLRLLDETQRRAAREQMVSEIAGRVRASLDPDTILKTTVRELGHALGAQMTAVEITRPGGDDGGFSEEKPTRKREE